MASAGIVNRPGTENPRGLVGQESGACCFVGSCTADVSQADCEAIGGVYQGDGTFCLDVECPAGAAVAINEIRIDQPGADTDEYFELAGPPGASLDELTYLVIGNQARGGAGSGVIQTAVSLDGHSLGGTALGDAGYSRRWVTRATSWPPSEPSRWAPPI
jgi:hypothetical protein